MRYVFKPCPMCGERFDFSQDEITSIDEDITSVDEFLMASTGGKCPTCGTQVVVDVDALSAARTDEEIQAVRIADVDYFSVRCRVFLARNGIETVGDILQLTRDELSNRLRSALLMEEIDHVLASNGLRLKE